VGELSQSYRRLIGAPAGWFKISLASYRNQMRLVSKVEPKFHTGEGWVKYMSEFYQFSLDDILFWWAQLGRLED